MEKVVDYIMTRLFQLAEYILSKYSLVEDEAATPPSSPVVPTTIRFSNEDRATLNKIEVVEGELFK